MVVAGPNGSGKSSVIGQLDYEGRENLLDPDAIAKRINPENLQQAAISAAREVIQRTRQYLHERQSFAIETTLSSGRILETMRLAREGGFIGCLTYLCLDSAERNIQRVRERVSRGGHDVPADDVRRRYERSLANLPPALRLAHRASAYDNSEGTPRRVLETRDGVIVWRANDQPAWVTQVRKVVSGQIPGQNDR